jgi:hypothetical protein
MQPQELRSPGFTARILGTSIRTLERKRADGTGPRFVKVSRLVRYTDHDLEEYASLRPLTRSALLKLRANVKKPRACCETLTTSTSSISSH